MYLFGLFLSFSNLLLGKFDEPLEDELGTGQLVQSLSSAATTYFDRANVCVLSDVLVLVEAILCRLSFS